MLELLFSKAGAYVCGSAGAVLFILYIRYMWKKEGRNEERVKIAKEGQKEDEKLKNIADKHYNNIKR